MYVAPKDDQLIVEARVNPNDIDNVQSGQKAKVQLTAFKRPLHNFPNFFQFFFNKEIWKKLGKLCRGLRNPMKPVFIKAS